MQQPQEPFPAADLPPFALVEILKAFSQDDRLRSCAVVSKGWQEAAIAATSSISKRCLDYQQLEIVLTWLNKYSQHVTKVTLHNQMQYCRPSELPVIALPLCANLQELRLSNFSLRLVAADDQVQDVVVHDPQQKPQDAGCMHQDTAPYNHHRNQLQPAMQSVLDADSAHGGHGQPQQQQQPRLKAMGLAALTRLTSLSLRNCIMLEGPDHWTQLSCLRGLQHLSMDQSTWRSIRATKGISKYFDTASESPESSEKFRHLQVLPGSWLSALHQLTSLELEGVVLQPLSCLCSLQELRLRVRHALPLPGMHCLPQLTKLEVAHVSYGVHHGYPAPSAPGFTTSHTPWLSQLTTLQQLCLSGCAEVDPAVLAPLNQLRHLELETCRLSGSNADGTSALLSWLRDLQQLTHLQLSITDAPCAPGAAYAALTASRQLHTLDLAHMRLPEGLWDQLFAQAQLLPELQKLRLPGWQCFNIG